MLSLSDEELAIVMNLAAAIPVERRDVFLEAPRSGNAARAGPGW
jgi:hypothetical protein